MCVNGSPTSSGLKVIAKVSLLWTHDRQTDKQTGRQGDSYILSTAKDFCEWSRNRGGVAQKFLLNR